MINGLHSCKPQNTPMVGQIKSFLVTPETSQRTGNQWTKITNKKPEEGGQWYSILTVAKTNRPADQHGNISFNLDIEPSDPPVQQQAPQNAPQSSGNGPVTRPNPSASTDTVEQHIMRSVNLYGACFRVAATAMRDLGQRLNLELSVEDYRQIATTLYIDAKSAGYIAHMPDQENKKKDPF